MAKKLVIIRSPDLRGTQLSESCTGWASARGIPVEVIDEEDILTIKWQEVQLCYCPLRFTSLSYINDLPVLLPIVIDIDGDQVEDWDSYFTSTFRIRKIHTRILGHWYREKLCPLHSWGPRLHRPLSLDYLDARERDVFIFDCHYWSRPEEQLTTLSALYFFNSNYDALVEQLGVPIKFYINSMFPLQFYLNTNDALRKSIGNEKLEERYQLDKIQENFIKPLIRFSDYQKLFSRLRLFVTHYASFHDQDYFNAYISGAPILRCARIGRGVNDIRFEFADQYPLIQEAIDEMDAQKNISLYDNLIKLPEVVRPREFERAYAEAYEDTWNKIWDWAAQETGSGIGSQVQQEM